MILDITIYLLFTKNAKLKGFSIMKNNHNLWKGSFLLSQRDGMKCKEVTDIDHILW